MMDLQEKLSILTAGARYDVSCASSGVRRGGRGLGSAASCGICHTYTPDGRCVSLLKLLLSNKCRYDCRYCINRCSSNTPRAEFTPEEVCALTSDFYRRNLIEGLFLSSAVSGSADDTMEKLLRSVRMLRQNFFFNGYIHLKVMPGCSQQLITEAGRWADRLSANIELPTDEELTALAPQKRSAKIEAAMGEIHRGIAAAKERRHGKIKPPPFSPGGQSTQMIVGATRSSDRTILRRASGLYEQHGLKRVYYSAFTPVSSDPALPPSAAPSVREHRLYEADWLLRLYGFEVEEFFEEAVPDLPLDIDPKLAWALHHRSLFPIDVNRAPHEMLLRVPGIGVRGAGRIAAARRQCRLSLNDLKRMRISLSKARYFITALDPNPTVRLLDSPYLKTYVKGGPEQLSLFARGGGAPIHGEI